MAIFKSALTPEYAFNGNAHRYISVKSGRFVSNDKVRDAINQVIQKTEAKFKEAAQKLVDRQTNIKEFQASMVENIKNLVLATSIAANGGFANMTSEDYGRVGNELKQQYKYLQNFCNELATNKQPLDGRAMSRAVLYARAAYSISQEVRRRSHAFDKNWEEKRVLGFSDHCHGGPGGCIEIAKLGWKPIGTLPKIGDSYCYVNCRCHFEFKRAA